jgi:pimeloyl-ACP methyl ester carboxylesterase
MRGSRQTAALNKAGQHWTLDYARDFPKSGIHSIRTSARTADSFVRGFRMLKSSLVAGLAIASIVAGQEVHHPFTVNQTEYTVRAGERVDLFIPPESLAFARLATRRNATATGPDTRNFGLGPDIDGNKVLLGVPFITEPGVYSVEVAFVSATGEERATTLKVKVEPFAYSSVSSSDEPPVILLDGFQLSGSSSCPMSSDSSGTFGNLQMYLEGSPNNAVVYFFENCSECPNCSVEELGAYLGGFINVLGAPQVDVVAHSMGGLIVRSYLSGKEATSGVFSPPSAQKIRKAVFVATPHFGAFAADFALADLFLAAGTQTNELKPGSQFVWDLGTWNQNRDDLRGVDALSIVGNAGPSQQSDGVVESTSASLDFTMPGRTRVVGYCHVPPSTADGLAGKYLGCEAPGIAYVTDTLHPTYQIVSSFLMDGTAWEGVGNAPGQDAYLSQYGGMVVADISSYDEYLVPSAASWGSVSLNEGGASELYYNDFVSGSATFNFGSSTCGPYTETAGVYSTVRCKFSPVIYSIGPLLAGAGKVVQAGGTITINGVGFGSQCSGCIVAAANPTSVNLQVLSWSDSTIIASLPATYGNGIVTIGVTTASGYDAMNIMAAPPAFFAGSVSGGGGTQFLQFPDGVDFGYYAFVGGAWLYHVDMGYESVVAGSGTGVYFWDLTSGHWFYTDASTFPYLYDFTLNAWLYYFPSSGSPGHYTTNPRYFSNLATGKIFTM